MGGILTTAQDYLKFPIPSSDSDTSRKYHQWLGNSGTESAPPGQEFLEAQEKYQKSVLQFGESGDITKFAKARMEKLRPKTTDIFQARCQLVGSRVLCTYVQNKTTIEGVRKNFISESEARIQKLLDEAEFLRGRASNIVESFDHELDVLDERISNLRKFGAKENPQSQSQPDGLVHAPVLGPNFVQSLAQGIVLALQKNPGVLGQPPEQAASLFSSVVTDFVAHLPSATAAPAPTTPVQNVQIVEMDQSGATEGEGDTKSNGDEQSKQSEVATGISSSSCSTGQVSTTATSGVRVLPRVKPVILSTPVTTNATIPARTRSRSAERGGKEDDLEKMLREDAKYL